LIARHVATESWELSESRITAQIAPIIGAA
jgi:hypothetical protein